MYKENLDAIKQYAKYLNQKFNERLDSNFSNKKAKEQKIYFKSILYQILRTNLQDKLDLDFYMNKLDILIEQVVEISCKAVGNDDKDISNHLTSRKYNIMDFEDFCKEQKLELVFPSDKLIMERVNRTLCNSIIDVNSNYNLSGDFGKDNKIINYFTTSIKLEEIDSQTAYFNHLIDWLQDGIFAFEDKDANTEDLAKVIAGVNFDEFIAYEMNNTILELLYSIAMKAFNESNNQLDKPMTYNEFCAKQERPEIQGVERS